ncbi:hypothetical protein J5N97_028632 [Dioscorea zingiberensis]|uniref:DUF4378 domain-containing protein n=1 Tax=Dioscorea zingiberensis TaxID=325984 RepID=A0A9D5H511_9LILI|nr:hypothetical protein J5N97_028632 [Dioscorea zingiberensis]
MAAKFLHVFADENSELKKQIGCMTGFFQMFERHQFTPGRRSKRLNHKRMISSGHVHSSSSSSPIAEHNGSSPQIVLEKNPSKNFSENQRASMESSRTSFSSSSCSSSFSSLECNRSTQEPPSNEHTGHQSLEFRDVVKESIYRETRGLSINTSSKDKEEANMKNAFKHRDSPRPDKSCGIGLYGKSRKAMDMDESLRVLVRLKEAHCHSSVCSEEPRQSFEGKASSICLGSRDTPRFSCDGREASREDTKLASKLRESPRLSLDSRQSSVRSSNLESKLNSIVSDSCKIRTNRRTPAASNLEQESSSQTRHSLVVAKLMGLETMPSLNSDAQKQICLSRSLNNNVCVPSSGKRKNGATKPSQERKQGPPSKPKTNAIETAPWRQQEKLPIAKKPPFRHRPESVYSEIEKRLKDLEVLQCNKDLMVLKKFLDAMHVPKNTQPQIVHPIPVFSKGSAMTKAFESPIVVMKPMKCTSKSSASSSSVSPLEGLSGLRKLRTGETSERKKSSLDNKMPRDQKSVNKVEENSLPKTPSRMVQSSSSKPQVKPKENNGNSVKTSGSLSPRLQQRKVGEEKKIRRPPMPSLDLNKTQKQSPNRQPSESVSPRGKLGRKPAKTLSNDDRLSEASSETRNFSQPGSCDETSLRSYSNISMGSSQKHSLTVNEDAATAAPEQPSPISVLDASFYQDDMPHSPVKKNSNSFKDDSTSLRNLSPEINHKKLKSIEILVQKLSQLSSKDGETQTTDHIASLCETQNPDHRYISEILLASGLLMKDLTAGPIGTMPLQLHPSGHPINPDLFLVLEQTKSETALRQKNGPKKLHRKLIFNVVNEVLAQKLELTSPFKKVRKLSRSLPTGQRLLKEVCLEIDQLQNESSNSEKDGDNDNLISGEEVLRKSVEWQDFGSEVPELVLEIERSIFKELIDEVVCCEADAAALQAKSHRRRRQLFAK